MNNREAMQKAFEGQKFKVFSPFACDISKNEDGDYVDDETIFAFAWFCRGIASQAQPVELLSNPLQLPSQAQQEPVSSDYTVLIGRLAYALKKANPDSDLPLKATEFLQRKGHTFDPLRDASQAQQEPVSRNWDEDYRDGENEYECICSICGKHFMGHKRRPFCKVCASNPQSAPETIEFWRHRALTAKSAFEGAMRMLGAENGKTFMGEPVLRKSLPPAPEGD